MPAEVSYGEKHNGSKANEQAVIALRQLIALASGVLVLTLTFLKDLSGPLFLNPLSPVLYIGWILLFVSVWCGWVSLAQAARQLSIVGDRIYHFSQGKLKWLARIAQWTFFGGLALITFFTVITLALERPTAEQNIDSPAGKNLEARTIDKSQPNIIAYLDSIQNRVHGLDSKITQLTIKLDEPVQHESRSGWTIFISILLIVCGVTLFIFSLSNLDWETQKAVAITATLCSSLITFSGVKVFGLEKFEGDIKFYERNDFHCCDGDSITHVNTISKLRMDSLGSVSGFQIGKPDQGFSTAQLNQLRETIQSKKDISVLILVGEVDKRELNGDLGQQYGSNITLARARAEFIKLNIDAVCDQMGISILTLNRGSYHTGKNLKDNDMTLDRQVVVYGLVSY